MRADLPGVMKRAEINFVSNLERGQWNGGVVIFIKLTAEDK